MKKQFLAVALLGFVSSYATMKFDVTVSDGLTEALVDNIAIDSEEESVVELGAFKMCMCLMKRTDCCEMIHCKLCRDEETLAEVTFDAATEELVALAVEDVDGNQVVVTVVPHDDADAQSDE